MDTKIRKAPKYNYSRNAQSNLLDSFKASTDRVGEWMNMVDKWGIEFGGAFAIVFVVGMAIHQHQSEPMIAAAFGTVITVLHAVFEQQHFNPFFTGQAFITEIVSGQARTPKEVLLNMLHVAWIWGLQLAGSVAGASALAWVFNSNQLVGATIPPDNINAGQIIFYEFIASFFYGMVLFSLSSQGGSNDTAAANQETRLEVVQKVTLPFVSGLSIFIATATIFPYTGASINFVRSVGPAIISGQTKGLAYVFAGQVLGYVSSGCLFNMRCIMRKWSSRKVSSQ